MVKHMKFEGNSNRYMIVFWCTLFNLLFEYSMRGVNNLIQQPFLFILLFGIYFTYFLALEDLIVRFKIGEIHLLAIAFFFGTFYSTFATGIVFVNPNFLGINFVNLLFVNIVWWGLLQAILTFYFANRLTLRDWNHPLMGKTGWSLFISYQTTALLIFQFANPLVPKGSPLGYFIISTIFITSFIACLFLIQRQRSKPKKSVEFKPSTLMDVLAFCIVILFFVLALFFTGDPLQSGAHQINQLATKIVTVWSLLIAGIMVFYRFARRTPFPV